MSPAQITAEALALHEAAHYTVAREVGFRAEGATTRNGEGLARFSYMAGHGVSAEGRRQRIAVAFAGSLAERIRYGHEICDCSGDQRRAEELLLTFPAEDRVRVGSECLQLAGDHLRRCWSFVLSLMLEIRGGRSWGLA